MMRFVLGRAFVAGLVALLPAAPGSAASPFDGVWITDLASVAPRPKALLVSRGQYRCGSCTPPLALPADGGFHAVSGRPDIDEAAVRVIDDRAIAETWRARGRVVRFETIVVDPGGRTATLSFTDTINPGIAPVSGRQRLRRTGAAPAGAHAASGEWISDAPSGVSENGLTQTMAIVDDVLTVTSGEGLSYTATLDGTPSSIRGDPTVDSASVRRVAANRLVETDSLAGVPVVTLTMTVSADGRRLTTEWDNHRTGRRTTTTAHRK